MSKIIEPLIRFKGFTDAWEQRKLGDESIEILAGGDIDKNKVTDNGKYPIYANVQYVVFLYTLFYFHLIINSCCSGSGFQPGGSFFRG